MSAGERLMKVAELAKRLDVSRSDAYEIVAAGHIDWTDVGTGKRPSIRISEAALSRYIKARERKGPKAA